jgi:hypothetical protein
MGEGSELHQSVLRAVLYAMMELVKNVDGNEVLAHLMLNVPDYYGDMTQRELAVELADYLARQAGTLRPDEASAARVLREFLRQNQVAESLSARPLEGSHRGPRASKSGHRPAARADEPVAQKAYRAGGHRCMTGPWCWTSEEPGQDHRWRAFRRSSRDRLEGRHGVP